MVRSEQTNTDGRIGVVTTLRTEQAAVESLTASIREAGGADGALAALDALVGLVLSRVNVTNQEAPAGRLLLAAKPCLVAYLAELRRAPPFYDLLGQVRRSLAPDLDKPRYISWSAALAVAERKLARVDFSQLSRGVCRIVDTDAGAGTAAMAIAHLAHLRHGAKGPRFLHLQLNDPDVLNARLATAQFLANWGLADRHLGGLTVTCGMPNAQDRPLLVSAEPRVQQHRANAPI